MQPRRHEATKRTSSSSCFRVFVTRSTFPSGQAGGLRRASVSSKFEPDVYFGVKAPGRLGSANAMNASCLLLAVSVLIYAPMPALADDPYAAQLFAQHCASCHEAGAGGAARIPPVSQLKLMTPTAILKTLETGVMRTQAAVLSTNERQAVANFLGTAVTTARRREDISNPCP